MWVDKVMGGGGIIRLQHMELNENRVQAVKVTYRLAS